MPTIRVARTDSTRRLPVALTAAVSLVLSLLSVVARPASASPVFQNDTLRSGAALGVGRNDAGQTSSGSTTNPSLSFAALPAPGGGPVADAVSIAVGNGFVVWADHNGKVWSTGDNTNGKRGNGTVGGTDRVPVQATGFGGSGQPKAVKVTAFGNALDVLDSNGDVWQWGQVVNSSSNLGIQSSPSKLTFTGGGRIVDVSAGESFSLAVDVTGKAFTWGKNDRGQLGTGGTSTSPYPTLISGTKSGQLPIPPSTSTVWAEAGRDFAVYTVTAQNGGVDVWTWGRGDLYQQGNAKTTDQRSPVKVALTATGERVKSLSAGTSHAVLLTTNASGAQVVRWWGTQTLASGCLSATTPTSIPNAVGTGTHTPTSVAAGDSNSFITYADGTVSAWGRGANGQLGNGATTDVTTLTAISIPGLLPLRESGIPVQMFSRSGETYALLNADITTSPDMTGLPYSFGMVPTNPSPPGAAATHVFTFTNSSTQALTGVAFSLRTDKDNASSTSTDFSPSSTTCSSTLAVNASCTVTVAYAPTSSMASTAFLVLSTTNTGLPVLRSVVKVTGQGYVAQRGLTGYQLTMQGPTNVGGKGNVIDLRSLNPKLIPDSFTETTGAASLTKLPLVELSLTKLPTSTASLTKISLTKLSLTKISLTKLSLTKISLTKLPITSLTKLSLTKISLTKLPLDRLGGWADLLQAYPSLANVPVSSLTVADLVDPTKNQPSDPSTGLPLERVSLGDIDVRNSALANVSFLALLQGGMRLDQYPVDWCSVLPTVPNGGTCSEGNGLARTLFELSLSNPMDIGLTPVGAVTVGQLTTDAASTTTNPLDDTAWGDILLAGTTLSGTHVGDIPLASIPDLTKVLDCSRTSCTNTAGRHLGDNDVVAALKPDAVFKDLGSALNPLKLEYLVEPFLDRSSFDWESLPRTAIPLQAYPNRLTYTAHADVECAHASDLAFGFQLPTGFTYVPGTTTLDTSPTSSIELSDPVNDPTDNPDRGLVVKNLGLTSTGGPLPCVNEGYSVTVHIGVLPTDTPSTSPYLVNGDVTAFTYPKLSAQQAGPGVTVTGINQPPDATPDGPVGREDTLILGHLDPGQQALYVPVDVPPGKIIEATLSGLKNNPDPNTDLDLTLYYPKGAAAGQALSGTGSATQVPFGESPLVEPGNGHPRDSASGGALQDIPLLNDRLVAAISALRGSDTEQLSAIARQGDTSRHTLAITSFNGASGDFTVRIRVLDPTSLASCSTTPLTIGAPASTTLFKHAGDPAGFGANDNTLVLVNASRQEAYYGNSAGVLEAAYQFTHGANGVKGQVLQVDSDPTVQAAYAAWDAHPCDPSYSNTVVRAINDLVLRTVDISKIKYVNIVGTHPVIPYAWLEDHTRDGSEREEAGDLTLNGGNPIAMASALGYFASDDPYGTFQPVAVMGQVVYAPQAVTGRLGETSAAAISQLQTFTTATSVAAAGVADPRTSSSQARSAVVTDYDFLTPGGNKVAGSLTTGGYAVDHSLSGAGTRWTESQLDAAWLHHSPIPDLGALNMHYDQYRALPALGAATNDLSDLYTSTGDVDSAGSLARHVVFTVGCHSGLGIPDSYAVSGDARAHDFAQAYGAQNLAVMIGNYGFGYADSATVAYSARLQSLYADRISQLDLGSALVSAKRRYIATLASLSPYDLKSVQEMVLWGIPQYRLPGVAAPGQLAAQSLSGPSSAVTDPMTGQPSQPITVGTSGNELRFTSGDGSQVYGNGSLTPPADDGTPRYVAAQATDPAVSDRDPHTVSNSGHPILAAQFVDLPATTDSSGNPLVVHSVVPRGLTSVSTYQGTSQYAAADSDHELGLGAGSEGEFPATLGHLWNLPNGSGWDSTFVMTPQQVQLDGTAPGHGQVRLFPRSDWTALYGPVEAPALDTINDVNASRNGTTTRYSVDITPYPGRTTVSAYVLALPASGSGTWVRTPLVLDPADPGHWTGEASGNLGAFIVVSTNDHAWSSMSTLKGLGWQPLDVTGGDDFTNLSLTGTVGTNDWFTSAPTATLTAGWTMTVDGAAVTTPYTFGNGDFLVRLKRPDGSLVVGHREVKVDTVVPTVTMLLDGLPASNAATFADDGNLHHVAFRSTHPLTLSVTAGPSGYALATQGTAPNGSGLKLDTSQLGAPAGGQVLSAAATSGAGLVGTTTWLFRSVYGSASFVAPTQANNLVLPILAYGYSFRAYDGNNAEVTTAPTGTFTATWSAATGCQPPGSINLPTGIASSAPSYSGGKWTWNLVAPLGGCQQLTGRLNDGYTKITTLTFL